MKKFKYFLIFIIIYSIFRISLIAFAGEQLCYTVVPFKGEDQKLSFDLAEMFMADLAKSGKIKLVDRLHFDNILDELSKMELALVKEEDAVDFGKAEGANKIISGSYKIIGDTITLNAWVADTKTSVVELSDSVDGNKKDIFYFVHQLANRLHYKITGGQWVPETSVISPATTPTPPAHTTPIPSTTPVAVQPTPQYVNPRPQETDPYLFIQKKEDWKNILDLSVDRGELSTYAQGDKMVISFRASEDCYITIYSIYADGSVHLVFPNKFHKDNFINGGTPYTVPSKKDFWEFVMRGTPGLESLIAIGTMKAVKLEVEREKLSGLDLMPRINSSPNEFIAQSVIPRLNLEPENKWVVKVLKYYLSEGEIHK